MEKVVGINGNLTENKIKNKKNISYILTFTDVIGFFACELDTYENLDIYDSNSTSFNIVENSKLLKNFPIRKDFDKSKYKHYQLFTYDDIIKNENSWKYNNNICP
ncbi:hypothetical protein PIROE2DRAFT_2899 [Piromyces sp. E2]|nr:hypothetical protein PIROE2DRAFT_2899 [Piromyces sp. E2]|eukprot:OUM69200.1 hypothetical protein PIROE2DRAFT_2899 [Piromyces sp. E2]